MKQGVYMLVNIGGKLVPCRVVKSATVIVVPINGHLGDGEEPQQEVPLAACKGMFSSDLEVIAAAGIELSDEERKELSNIQTEEAVEGRR